MTPGLCAYIGLRVEKKHEFCACSAWTDALLFQHIMLKLWVILDPEQSSCLESKLFSSKVRGNSFRLYLTISSPQNQAGLG